VLFLCGGQTVFPPETIRLVAIAGRSRAVASEIPFMQLDFFDQFSLRYAAGLDLSLLGNRANILQFHDSSPDNGRIQLGAINWNIYFNAVDYAN
jgi:hypothetical protein